MSISQKKNEMEKMEKKNKNKTTTTKKNKIYIYRYMYQYMCMYMILLVSMCPCRQTTMKSLKMQRVTGQYFWVSHEVLFYEYTFFTPRQKNLCLWPVRRSEQQWGVESILERPITCVSALYDARQASQKEKNIQVGSFPELIDSTPTSTTQDKRGRLSINQQNRALSKREQRAGEGLWEEKKKKKEPDWFVREEGNDDG